MSALANWHSADMAHARLMGVQGDGCKTGVWKDGCETGVWEGLFLASMSVLWFPTCLIKKRLLSELFLESSESCPTVEQGLAYQTNKSRQTGWV